MPVEIKSMGISVPIISRGINKHEPIRQSMATLDGRSLDGENLYAHELVIVGSNNAGPGFRHLPVGTDLATTGNALKDYVNDRGANISETGADAIAPALDFLRDSFYVVWNGAEHKEMPLVRNTTNLDASHDACFQLKSGHVTRHVMKGIPADKLGDVVVEGCLCVFVNNTTGAISIGATGGSPAGVTEFPIKGTMVVSKGTVTDNAGDTHVVINYVC